MPVEPKMGRMIMYCPTCNRNFATSDDRFAGECTACGMPVFVRRCTRCGHQWRARRITYISKVCPKCKSPYWNRERIRR